MIAGDAALGEVGGARLISMESSGREIDLPRDLDREIAREAESRGQTWETATTDLLTEAVRMRRAPGILFADGPTGRRAVVAGSGLDVWEMISAWQEGGRDFEDLRRNYEWLTEAQLRSALQYYELYPEEIDARLERERRCTPESFPDTEEDPSPLPMGQNQGDDALSKLPTPHRELR
jgi:uncharacterized protein (DUF433 family)